MSYKRPSDELPVIQNHSGGEIKAYYQEAGLFTHGRMVSVEDEIARRLSMSHDPEATFRIMLSNYPQQADVIKKVYQQGRVRTTWTR